MSKVDVLELVAGLRAIPDEHFVCQNVYDYLGENPVAFDSVDKYLHWSDKFYTRNLIHKDARFEMMAICWEVGQASRVHDHSGQRCWMTVPYGQLKGQNFAVESMDEAVGHCKLSETDSFILSETVCAKVELEEPIHQVLNLAEWNQRAVSIHIYSRPYDSCISYCRDTDTFKEVKLCYTSVDGVLCDGIEL